jgi:hypothetical protein
MALPVSAYRAIGGMTPKKSGEDFYFLQKLVKYGNLLTWNEEKVYPEARFSERVFFGTGPAMIKGNRGDWGSYPVYHYRLFDEVKETYDAFPALYTKDMATPLGDHLSKTPGQGNIWEPLRKNAGSPGVFVKACTEKIDGLRILQFLKHRQTSRGYADEQSLLANLRIFQSRLLEDFDFLQDGIKFDGLTVMQLDKLRDALVSIEEEYQKEHHG